MCSKILYIQHTDIQQKIPKIYLDGVFLKPGGNCWGMGKSVDKLECVTVLSKYYANGTVWYLNTGSDSVQFAFEVDYDFITSSAVGLPYSATSETHHVCVLKYMHTHL